MTVGNMASSLAPFLAQSGYPTAMLITAMMIGINITLTCFLSEAGAYLVKVKSLDASETFAN